MPEAHVRASGGALESQGAPEGAPSDHMEGGSGTRGLALITPLLWEACGGATRVGP